MSDLWAYVDNLMTPTVIQAAGALLMLLAAILLFAIRWKETRNGGTRQ